MVYHASKQYEISQRRACKVFSVSRSTQRYRIRKEDKKVNERLMELAEQRHRFGYRRLHILLKREGWGT